jgi:hypothetical protein
MKLNRQLQKKRDCLDQCSRFQETCDTVLKTKKACADRFESCTTRCEFDHS